MSDQLLEAIITSLKTRPEVTAVWLAGSRGRGTHDEYSDIDIWVAVDDAAIAGVVADPLAYVHQIVPTIMHVVAPEIAPAGGAFVGSWAPDNDSFDQVDWYIVPSSNARRAMDTKVVCGEVPVEPERAPTSPTHEALQSSIHDNLVLALQMINNMIKHARRDNTWRALDHARHADGCIVKAQWLLEYGTVPDFRAMKRSILPAIATVSESNLQSLAYLLLDQIQETTADAVFEEELSAAIAAMRAEIDRWQSAGRFVTETGIQILSEAEFYASLPRRRVASGLFITNARNEVLLLETTYKQEWETPGGISDAGESPRVTATREVVEEIGLAIPPGNLLVIQHVTAPAPRGDMLVYLYDGGVIDDPDTITIDRYEIRAAHFVPLEQVHLHTKPEMTRRLHAAMRAREEGRLIEIGSDLPDD